MICYDTNARLHRVSCRENSVCISANEEFQSSSKQCSYKFGLKCGSFCFLPVAFCCSSSHSSADVSCPPAPAPARETGHIMGQQAGSGRYEYGTVPVPGDEPALTGQSVRYSKHTYDAEIKGR